MEPKDDVMYDFIDMAFQVINDTPQVKDYFDIMEQLAVNEPELKTPADYFRYGTIMGMAKAMHDISKGYINITTVQIDKGEPHEDNQEPNNRKINRNESPGDGQAH